MENYYLPYGKQNISTEDIKNVVEVLKSEFITQGPIVNVFEDEVAKKVGSKFAVSHNSATSALHTACLALGLDTNDRIWTSPITFVATANCGLYCGAYVDFVDIDKNTGLMCVESLSRKLQIADKEGKLPKIVIPVHLGGASCDMYAISKLSKKYGFSIIEDASHAIGGKYLNEPVGNCKFSQITVFSFHPVKIITCGEGGIACTNDESLAMKMKSFASHGITKDKDKFVLSRTTKWGYEQQNLGFNYRLSDIHAALGLSQLKRLELIVLERNNLLKFYKKLFLNSDIKFISIPQNVYSAFHLAIVKVCNNNYYLHKKIFDYMRQKNIGVQLHYQPVHLQPYYLERGFKLGDFPQAEDYANSYISIPLFQGLEEKDQKRVFDVIVEATRSEDC